MSLRERIAASTVWPMLWKEFIQMRRDRLTLGMMLGIPAIQLAMFGYAIQTEVRHLPTVVLDESRSAESLALVDQLRNTGNFDIVRYVADRKALDDEIRTGRAMAGVVIPPTYLTDLRRGRVAEAQVIVDAADPLASSAAMGGAAQAGLARALTILSRTTGRGPPIEIRVRPWYNPGLRSAVYIVPGIIGVLLSVTMILITSMSIVRERERGTLEQLIVTPIDKTSLMIGKIVPFILVGYVQMTVILILGRVLFNVPIRGSLLLLYALTFAFIVASLGMGLFISTMVRTQAQSMQLGFFFLLPNILLSGFMFPREAMPLVAQWIGLV
ncbi:MAG TPA: ABC transporter permease, partial [Gemmatimonadales bacterium]|nr:ABC transporter permease [Gemmatimonadales bacterium]